MRQRVESWPHPCRGRGFGLIETLLAVLLLSVGIGAYLNVQQSSLREAMVARYRATAMNLANDMADRIRANAQEVMVYAAQSGLGPIGSRVDVSACVAVSCTASALADVDVRQWSNVAYASLVRPAWILRQTGASAGAVGGRHWDLWVIWDEPLPTQNLGLGSSCPPTESAPAQGTRQCVHLKLMF